jgi:hypothetical protein
METITTIIVTAFLNLAISTGVFLRVQKNIELSFAKQLEEFRVTLQKSLAEHQIKFSTTYPKTLEVLQGFFEEFQAAAIAFNILCQEPSPDERDKQKTYPRYELEKNDTYQSLIIDCSVYFYNNRHYLADSIASEIETILETASKLGTSLVILTMLFFMPEDKRPETLEGFASRAEFPAHINRNDKDVLGKYAEVYSRHYCGD